GETLLDLADAQSPAASIPLLEGQLLQVVLDRVVLSSDGRRRITESLETALVEGEGRATVEVVGQRVVRVSREFRCPSCDVGLARPQPVLFSFNHPLGACPECKGFGNILRYDESLVVPDPTRSISDGAVEPWSHPSGRWYQKQLVKAAKKRGVDVTRPYGELDANDREWIYQGGEGLTGIQGFFEEVESYRYKLHVRVFLSRYRSQWPCPRCGGARLKPEALTVKVGGATIADWNSKTVEDLHAFLAGIAFSPWEEAVGRAGATLLPPPPSLLPPARRSRLSRPGPPDADPVGRRGSAHQPRQSAGGAARGHPLRARRAVHRPPRPRHGATSRALPRAGRRREHRGHRGARPLLHRVRRLSRRDGARLGRARRQRGLRGHPGRVRPGHALPHRGLSQRTRGHPATPVPPGGTARPGDPGRARAQPQEPHGAHPPPHPHLRHRRLRLGQVHPRARHALPRDGAALQGRAGATGRARTDPRHGVPEGRAPDRSGADRPHPPLESRDLREGLRRDPQALRRAAARQGPRPDRGRLLLQCAGRALRGVPGRRAAEARDVLLRGRVRDLP